MPVLNGTVCHFSPHAPPVTSTTARASGVTGYGTCASGSHQFKEIRRNDPAGAMSRVGYFEMFGISTLSAVKFNGFFFTITVELEFLFG